MKKILAMMLSVMMILSMGISVFAEGEETTTPGITYAIVKEKATGTEWGTEEDCLSVYLTNTPAEIDGKYSVELWAGEILLATVWPLDNAANGPLYDTDTCAKFVLSNGVSDNWEQTQWDPSAGVVPTKVVLRAANGDELASSTTIYYQKEGTVLTSENWKTALLQTVTLTKIYKETNEDTTSPEETFAFSDLTCVSVEDSADDVSKDNAPIPTIGTVTYGAGDASVEGMEKTVEIELPLYEDVGVYTYTFTETAGNTAGVTYRSEEIKLVVTVIQDANGKIRVAAIHTESSGDKSDEFTNTYSAGSLSVKKIVTGNLGDQTKDFKVTVTFTAPKNGDKFLDVNEAITYVEDGETKTIAAKWSDGTAKAEITLKHDETVTFTNIPYGVTYTVEEEDYTGDGYTATYDFSDTAKNIDTAKDTVEITNDKNNTVDTGISVDSIPYIAMLGVVAIGGTGFLVSKKRRSED